MRPETEATRRPPIQWSIRRTGTEPTSLVVPGRARYIGRAPGAGRGAESKGRRAVALGELEDNEAIKALKYAYLRLLDLKRFEELGELLTEGCTASYEDGRRSYEGRAAIVGFLTKALGDPGIVSSHRCHHPEIAVGRPGSGHGDLVPDATGWWSPPPTSRSAAPPTTATST